MTACGEDKKVNTESLEVNGITYPVNIHYEDRDNSRISIGKTAITLRIPTFLDRNEKARQLMKMKAWARKKLTERPERFERQARKEYADGDILKVGDEEFSLSIAYKDKQSSSIRLIDNIISLSISSGLQKEQQNRHISTLLSRCMARRKIPQIRQRVHELNRLHFNHKVNRVFLKHNRSSWGSCSEAGNINISTRALFAPPEVSDYLIIHELAHLAEPNHSERFWALVKGAMPDYKEKKRWLRENDTRCGW